MSFKFTYCVNLDDLDYMGIVGNANWLIFLERSRADLLAELDYPIQKLMKNGQGGVVAELNVKYMRPAKYGQKISITVRPSDPSEYGGVLNYLAEDDQGNQILTAWTKMVFVDQSGRPIPIPSEIKNKLYG